MFVLLSMAVVLAAFFTTVLWLDPARRRKSAVAAVLAGGAFALSDTAPTVGGDAFAQEDCTWDGTTLTCPLLFDPIPGWSPPPPPPPAPPPCYSCHWSPPPPPCYSCDQAPPVEHPTPPPPPPAPPPLKSTSVCGDGFVYRGGQCEHADPDICDLAFTLGGITLAASGGASLAASPGYARQGVRMSARPLVGIGLVSAIVGMVLAEANNCLVAPPVMAEASLEEMKELEGWA